MMSDNTDKDKKIEKVGSVIFWIFLVGGGIWWYLAHHDGNENIINDNYDIIDTTPTNISPHGELADIFNPFSDYTDLQREDTINRIKGKVIEWTLPVYEVKRDGTDYTVIFESSGKTVGVIAVFNNPNQEELNLLKALKTGTMLKFKGVIKGTWLRSIMIDPANIPLPESDRIIMGTKKALSQNFSSPYSSLKNLISKANKGDVNSAYRAGILLYDYSANGNYNNNLKDSLKYLKRAERQGIVYARAMRTRIGYDLARQDHDSEQMEKFENDAKRLIKLLKPLCDDGINEAQYMTARLFIGVLGNDDAGIHFYKIACQNKNLDACKYLGNIYSKRDDFAEAQRYYEICARQGEALCNDSLKSLQAKKDNFQKDGIQMAMIKFEGASGSEFNGSIFGKDEKNKDISFIYDYDNKDIAIDISKMKEGKLYRILYKTRYFDDTDPSQGHYEEIVQIYPVDSDKKDKRSSKSIKKPKNKAIDEINKALNDLEKMRS